MNATGTFIPPAMIFPRLRHKPELYRDAPAGTLQMISESGYMNATLFVDYLKHFQNHVRATAENPALLIIDNHSSHITLEGITFARDNHITILTLPPHSSHQIQPLDRVFFGPLKSLYANEVNKWHTRHPGQCLAWMDLSGLFKEAYVRAASVQTIQNSPFLITKLSFLGLQRITHSTPAIIHPIRSDTSSESLTTSLSPVTLTNSPVTPPITSVTSTISVTTPSASTDPLATPTIPSTSVIPLKTPSSGLSIIISPSKVLPLPKREKEVIQRRKKGTSAIITSSPYKQEKETEVKAQKEKETLKEKRALKRKTKQIRKDEKPKREEKATKEKENEKQIRKSLRKPKMSQQLPDKNENNSADESESCSNDEDYAAYCLYCTELYVSSKSRESWIQCMNDSCGLWAHTLCAGVDRYQTQYICEMCT